MAQVYESVFAVRQMAINQNGFTDIVGPSILPIDCNYIEIFNDSGQDITLASDPNNPNSQVTIHDGQMFTIGAPRGFDATTSRFQRGSSSPIGSLQSALSAVNVLILSIR